MILGHKRLSDYGLCGFEGLFNRFNEGIRNSKVRGLGKNGGKATEMRDWLVDVRCKGEVDMYGNSGELRYV